MKRFSEQLHKQSTTVKLQAAEKRELRERLVSYMEYHPLPATMKAAKTEKNTKSVGVPLFTEAFATFSIPFHKLFKYSAVAAALLLVFVPFVAEKAVPGDSLYAIKVQFNEELRSTLTFGSYQKVEWETERLNRRIAEARLLASEGLLTEEVEAEVAEAVRTHTENAKREIEELRTQDADEATIASIALDTTLEVQSASLKGEMSDIATGATSTMNARTNNLIANAIDDSRGQAEQYNSSSTLPAYDKLMARVETNTTRVYELLDSIKPVAPAEELTEVTRRLEDIERSVRAVIDLSGREEREAQLQLVNVLQRTQKLIVYMTDIAATETVDIETLVPVELTEVEVEALVEGLTIELDQKIDQITKLSVRLEDQDVLNKVDFALIALNEQAAQMTDVKEEDVVTFKKIAKDALTMANDTLILLEMHITLPAAADIPVPTATTTTGTTTDSSGTTTTQAEFGEVTTEIVDSN